MILIVAPHADPLGCALRGAVEEAGHHVAVVTGFTEIRWTLHIDDNGRAQTALEYGPRRDVVVAVVYLGVGPCPEDDEFTANERLSGWWSLLAGFDGTVVNRPSRHGLTLSMDRLRRRSHARPVPAAQLWLLRSSHDPTATGVIRSADDLAHVGLAVPGQEVTADDSVLEVIECIPDDVQRFVVCGNRLIPLAPDNHTSADFTAAARAELRSDLPALAVAVVERTAGDACELLDLLPFGSRPESIADVFAAVLEGLVEAVRDPLHR
jgi:hypothetical protein